MYLQFTTCNSADLLMRATPSSTNSTLNETWTFGPRTPLDEWVGATRG